ncbi:serine/threonine protein kinase [Bacillus salacetis]|uniref:serine/threonine protein kinase n=1 Tax=Bacillus salacetis TaxID=2315464 RepID=UPI003BA2737D
MNFFEKEWKPGFTIDNYVVESLLGKGSYGTAYLVKNKSDGRLSVLKRLRPCKRLIDPSGELLIREAEILKRLESDHFPKLISIGKQEKVPFLIMEYFEGKTFDQLIFEEGKVFSEKESLTLVKKVMELVILVHAKGIVHRDLRIPNIIQSEGSLKIIDFGLAAGIQADQSTLSKHKDYMREKGFKADYYALGHFLLFLLYSSFNSDGEKERSWEEELELSPSTKEILRKLLQIEEPFDNACALIHSLESALRQI